MTFLDKCGIILVVNCMKKLIPIVILIIIFLVACAPSREGAQIAATTLPVYEFTARICQGTDISVIQIVTENVSCLHDYTLKVDQMRSIESAEMIIINGAGLENFMEDAFFSAKNIVDSSKGLALVENESHSHSDEHGHNYGHTHSEDPHIWLSPQNAKVMAKNICNALSKQYPNFKTIFDRNLQQLILDLDNLQAYGEEKLHDLSSSNLITFHDGFSYLAESFDLTILRAIEEESGSEASAAELIELIEIVTQNNLSSIFIEKNGSVSAANIISAETNAAIFTLDMAMSGTSYFDAMYHNIDTLQEALQ